jgi:class 3 adenylate cyclase
MEPRSSPSAEAAPRQSRTNGFLFADLRGYTQFVEARGDRSAAELLDVYRRLVREAVGRFDGAEIKTEGDSFYVVFPSVAAAVECGIAIVTAAVAASTADRPIRVGIGVHAGETVETDEGYVGSAVNVAARVCSQARAGEVLVTDTVRALTRTHLTVRFHDRRTKRLKGVAEPVVLYTASPSSGFPTVPVAGRRGLLPTARVVVLLAGLLIGGAASGYILVAATRSPGAGPTPSSVVPSVVVAFPNEDEADLLAQVPSDVRNACARAAAGDVLAGAVASLRCDLALASEADTVLYHRFPTGQTLATAVSQIVTRERLAFAECGADTPRAQGNWRVGSTHGGRLLCYPSEGASWVVWTYEADRIMARAVRAGDGEQDWLGLYEWWSQIRLFLR